MPTGPNFRMSANSAGRKRTRQRTPTQSRTGLTAASYYRVWLLLDRTSSKFDGTITMVNELEQDPPVIQTDGVLLLEFRTGATSINSSKVFDRRLSLSDNVAWGEYDTTITEAADNIAVGFEPSAIIVNQTSATAGSSLTFQTGGTDMTINLSGTSPATTVREVFGFSTAANESGNYFAWR